MKKKVITTRMSRLRKRFCLNTARKSMPPNRMIIMFSGTGIINWTCKSLKTAGMLTWETGSCLIRMPNLTEMT